MAGLRSSPPPTSTVVQEWVLADYTELRQLRSTLRKTLQHQGLTVDAELEEMAERMAIVATELATNALRHAHSPAVVRLGRTRRAFVLDVADDQPLRPPRAADGGDLATGGRGLRIAQELATDTGWYVTGTGKHVWARFQAPRIPVSTLGRFVRRFRRVGN